MLVAVPPLIAVVTFVSNARTELSFLLFPPLASGAYTLFSDPEGRYASPRRFVVGLVGGALCGWAALSLSATPPTPTIVSPASAALSIFLAGVATRLLDVEEPAAFSTALRVLVTDDASPEAYVPLRHRPERTTTSASPCAVTATLAAAANTNCDLVVTPSEQEYGRLSPSVRGLFDGRHDTIAFRLTTGRQRWRRVLVTVARPGNTAHAMSSSPPASSARGETPRGPPKRSMSTSRRGCPGVR